MKGLHHFSCEQLLSLQSEKKKRLFLLEKQRARFGGDTPPHIILEIEEINGELTTIARILEDQLDTMDDQTPQARVEPRAASILLLTTTRIEVEAVLSSFKKKLGQSHKIQTGHHNLYYDLGEIGNTNLMMVRCEMGAGGPGGSSLTVSEAINELNPAAIIAVGIAFGTQPNKQSIGDILVSRQILSYELQRIGTSPNEEMVIVPRGDRPSASTRLLNYFRDGEIHWKNKATVQFGLLLSGAKLIDNIEFHKKLLELEVEAIGGEMEGVGLYDAAQRNHTDWIIVKSICDWADGKKSENKQANQAQAAINSADFVTFVLSNSGLTNNFSPSSFLEI